MKIINKRARRDYKLLETYEAGIALMGKEVKAIRQGSADISKAHVRVVNGELFLINAHIPVKDDRDYDPRRTRKLLMKKKEIVRLLTKTKAANLTLVPVKMYNKRRLVKVQIALAKGMRKFEKKEKIKKRDIQRQIEKDLRQKI